MTTAERSPWRQLVQTFAPVLRAYRYRMLGGLGLLGIIALLETSLPIWLKVFIDRYVTPGRWSEGIWLLGVYGVTYVSIGCLQYVQSMWMDTTAFRVMHTLRAHTFRHMMFLPLHFFHRQPAGKLMTRVTNDVDALQEILGQGLLSIVGDTIVSGAIFVLLWWISPPLAGVLTLTATLVVVASFLFHTHARRAQEQIRTALARLNAYLQEHIGGIQVLQIFCAEADALRRMTTLNHAYARANVDAVVHYAWYYPTIRGIEILSSVIVLVVGGWLYYQDQLTIGTLVAFFQYVQRFYEPLADLSDKYNILLQATVAGERIQEILNETMDPTYTGETLRLPAAPDIEFSGVRYRYPGQDIWVLKDIHIRIRPGERVLIAGPTGSGKTTLASLLLRFDDPTRGVIRINGIPLHRYGGPSVRTAVRMIFQEPFLFSDTVERNIVLDGDTACRQRLREWLDRFPQNPLLQRIRAQLSKRLHERGQNLSQSERQVIALLRGVLSDPAIIILDEALSATDPATERDLHEFIEAILAGRTVIRIAHRLHTIPDADRMVILWDGRVVEDSTPEEVHTRLERSSYRRS